TLARIETRNLAPKVNLTRKTTASASPTFSCESLLPTAAVGTGATIAASPKPPASGTGRGVPTASGCHRAAKVRGWTAKARDDSTGGRPRCRALYGRRL